MPGEKPFNLQEKIQSLPTGELQQFNSWLKEYKGILNQYEDRAKEIPVSMPAGKFLPVDGQKIISTWHEEGITQPSHADPEEVTNRLDRIGLYRGNDGTITFVGPDGRYWVGYASEENLAALEKADYRNVAQEGHVSVKNIMNADCKFADPNLQQQWEKWEEELKLPPAKDVKPAEDNNVPTDSQIPPEKKAEVEEISQPDNAPVQDWKTELRQRYFRELDLTGEEQAKMADLNRAYIVTLVDQGVATREEIINFLNDALNEKMSSQALTPEDQQALREETKTLGTEITGQTSPDAAVQTTPESPAVPEFKEKWDKMGPIEKSLFLQNAGINPVQVSGTGEQYRLPQLSWDQLNQQFPDAIQGLYAAERAKLEKANTPTEEVQTPVPNTSSNQPVVTPAQQTEQSPIPTREIIRLGRQTMGTEPEVLLGRINQDLANRTTNEVTFAESPQNITDYLKTIKLKAGAKIIEGDIQINGNKLSIKGIVNSIVGKVNFDVVYEQNPAGKLVVLGKPNIKKDLGVKLALKAKGVDIDEMIINLNQTITKQMNERINPHWQVTGMGILGNEIILNFKRK